MIPIRTSEAMARDGFVTVPFPADVAGRMLTHIRGHIGEACGLGRPPAADGLQDALATLSDEEFVDRFRKPMRMFPDDIGRQVNGWVEQIGTTLGGARAGINYVSRQERDGNPALNATSFDVFWRCVRPGKPDIGRPHADFQFWELARGTALDAPSPFAYDERWKIWLPLFGCDLTNSLQVVPGSHTQDVPLEIIDTKFGRKPSIPETWCAANEHRFVCPLPRFQHCAVLFHDKLVHRGPANETGNVRISGELTILLKL